MVGIVILNYNNIEDTLNCVKSIKQYNTYPIKIVIVDNGSSQSDIVKRLDYSLSKMFDGEYELIREGEKRYSLKHVTLLVSIINSGYAQGNNKGLELLYEDSSVTEILILNSDILFVDDIIGKLVSDLNKLEKAAIISPILYKKNMEGIDYNCARKAIPLSDLFIAYMFLFKDWFGILSKRSAKRNVLKTMGHDCHEKVVEIELPSGSCMLIRKDLFHDIGFFDPNTFLYNEENILWVKINRLGYKNYLDTSLKCIHLGATTTNSKVPSMFLLNCSLQSNHYYLTNYTNAGWLYLKCMKFFYSLIKIKHIIRNFKNK